MPNPDTRAIDHPGPEPEPARLNPNRTAWLIILAISGALFAIRLLAPPNLLDQDQERPASYVLDAVQNGNWIIQRDWTGDIASKPPLWTWLSAFVTLVCGGISEFSLYLPGALAAFGTACLIYQLGRRGFGFRASLIGAVAVLLTTAGAKGFGLARTDGVFAFTVTAAAFWAWRSWQTGRGWTWFWLLCAAATLTKGPLGVFFAATGLVAAHWEHRSGSPLPVRGNHLIGIIVFLALTLGWLLLAYTQCGGAVTDKLFQKELVGHVAEGHRFPGSQLYKQPVYYLGRAAPWSVLACFGLWRIWSRPSREEEPRRLERFLFCWFTIGLLVLSLASHQRADLLWPIMPAAALIAGIELDRLLSRFSPRRVSVGLTVGVLLGLAGFAAYYCVVLPRTSIMRQTAAVCEVAGRIRNAYPGEPPFTFVDAPMALQVYLNTSRKTAPFERAIKLLRAPEPAAIAVNEITAEKVQAQFGQVALYTLFQAPAFTPGLGVRILSNQADPAMESFAFVMDDWLLTAHAARLVAANERRIQLRALTPDWKIEIRNEAKTSKAWAVAVEDGSQTVRQTRRVGADQAIVLSRAGLRLTR